MQLRRARARVWWFVRWGGAAAVAVLVAAWVMCGWCRYWVQWTTPPGLKVAGGGGSFIVGTYPIGDRGVTWTDVRSGRHPASTMRWRGYWRFGHPQGWIVNTPLWYAIVPIGVLTAWTWRVEVGRRRHERTGGCRVCGYERAGSGVCPECGSVGASRPG